MINFNSSRNYATQLDAQDELASFREQFVIDDPNLLYMDGNSLGRLTKASQSRVREVLDDEWGRDLIHSWNKGWWDAPARIGESIAKLVGAAEGQVLVADQTSVNLFKLAASALALRPGRKRIVSDAYNFPSDLYVLQGVAKLLGRGHEVVNVTSRDGIIPDINELESLINEDTALVELSHVTFKSGYLFNMARITEMAHRKGALVLWDLCHSIGATPVALDDCNADFAIGCTYKYLNGGPGAPAMLYVNKKHQAHATSPIWGWWGQANPFAFNVDYQPAEGIARFGTGTMPMLSLLAMESALVPTLEAGLPRLRSKSIQLSEYLIALSDSILAPLGFVLGSPRDSKVRGSHISLRHADAYRINRALIEEMQVIPDFRAPDNIRLGLAPLYTTFSEVWETVERLRIVMEEKRYEKYSAQRLKVT